MRAFSFVAMLTMVVLAAYASPVLAQSEPRDPPALDTLRSVSPPHPVQESGTVRPTGTYQVVHLELEQGWQWRGGRDRVETQSATLRIGLRDGRVTTAGVARPTRIWFRDRESDLQLEGDRLHGDVVFAWYAQGGPLIRYSIDARVRNGQVEGVAGIVLQHGDIKARTGVAGSIHTRDELRRSNALTGGAHWNSYYGPQGGLAAQDTDATLVADPADARLVWKSEDLFGPAFGNAPDDRYGPFRPLQRNFGSGSSTPIIADGRIYFYYFVPAGEEGSHQHREGAVWNTRWTSIWQEHYGSGKLEGKAYSFGRLRADEVFICLDAATGELLWKTTHAAAGRNIQTHKWRGLSPTPTVHDGVVYFETYSGSLFAVDAKTGDTRWSDVRQANPDSQWQPGPHQPAPVVVGDVVVRGSQAFKRETGEQAWTTEARGIPLLWNRNDGPRIIYHQVGRHDPRISPDQDPGTLACVDPANGAVLWSTPISSTSREGHYPLLVGDALITVNHGVERSDVAGAVICFDLTDKGLSERWRIEAPHPYINNYGLVVHGDHAFVSANKEAIAIELASGKVVSRVKDVATARTGTLWGAHGRLLLLEDNRHGDLAFQYIDISDPTNMSVLRSAGDAWRLPIPPTSSYARHALMFPMVDGRLFVRGVDAIYCFDLRKAK